jgi:choline-glycine betaine transporter
MNYRIIVFAVVAAFLAGKLLANQPAWLTYLVGVGILFVTIQLFRNRGGSLKPGEMPRYGSIAWAEALYRAGMISAEELEDYKSKVKFLPPL